VRVICVIERTVPHAGTGRTMPGSRLRTERMRDLGSFAVADRDGFMHDV
jgi:hypothetical protein